MPSDSSPTSPDPHGDPLGAEPWPVWLAAILPDYCTHPFAPHHAQFWRWVWAVEPGVRPDAFVGVWPRGGAKSTSAEAACVALGARGKRRYALYVCDTQDRADDHVANCAAMLESERVELFYPAVSDRLVGKFGNSKGWRRNRLRCANGFTVDAIGLDTAARGVKLEAQRPDLMIVDDIDGQHDTAATTRKKIGTLTGDLLPAGAEDLAVVAIQNLIHPNGVFAQIVDSRADFLRRRTLSGPVPALRNLTVRREDGRDVVAGDPTWEGQSVERCQQDVDTFGLRAFVRECQHDVARVEGALWVPEQIDHVDDFPDLIDLAVAVDPSGGSADGNDAQGIVAVGRGVDGHAYVLADETCKLSPGGWGRVAVELAVDLQADAIVGETNYGGEMVTHTVRVAADKLAREGLTEAARFGTGSPGGVTTVNASRGKRVRAEPVAAMYGDRDRPDTWADTRVHHVGHLTGLEDELTTWDPQAGGKSPNRLDALVWAVTWLMLRAPESRWEVRAA